MRITTTVYLAVECTKEQFCASEDAVDWARSYLRDPGFQTGPSGSPEELWELLRAPPNGRKSIVVRLDEDPDGINGEPTAPVEGLGIPVCAAGKHEMLILTFRNLSTSSMVPFAKGESIIRGDMFFQKPLRFYAVLRREE